jgi:hypothetical protein
MTMRNNQLEQALLRAGFVKAKETKPTRVRDVHEFSGKPEWQSLTHAEREHYQQQFNASS